MKITFVNEVSTQAPESDDEKVTYHPDINEDDFGYDQECSDAEYNYIQLVPSNYISVVRCAFAQEDDWRRTVIFHTFIKIGDKN